MYEQLPGFVTQTLDDRHVCHLGQVPDMLLLDATEREELWEMHPCEFREF